MFALIIDSEAATTAAASGDALEQGGTFPDGPGGLMRAGAGVFSDSTLVHFIGIPVDKALVVIADQDRPFGARQMADAFP